LAANDRGTLDPVVPRLAFAVACLAAVLLASAGPATAGPRHVRIATDDRGPIHVWKPKGFDAETAGIVVYVHGYYIKVDRAWREHRLPRQFAEAGVNALFIACEAPIGPKQDVLWPSLSELLERVRDELGELPPGPVIAVGHSGAHRTLRMWLDDDQLATVALLDALYGELTEFRAWIEASDERRLINVGDATRRWTDALHRQLPDTLVFERFPPPRAGRLRGEREAKIVYVRSQLGHMPLVTDGVALPMVLRALRLPLVPEVSRTRPIRPNP
jgi:hypothetical protein